MKKKPIGKGRFHPSTIPGHEKFRRMLEANRKSETQPKRPKPKMYPTVKEAFEQK